MEPAGKRPRLPLPQVDELLAVVITLVTVGSLSAFTSTDDSADASASVELAASRSGRAGKNPGSTAMFVIGDAAH